MGVVVEADGASKKKVITAGPLGPEEIELMQKEHGTTSPIGTPARPPPPNEIPSRPPMRQTATVDNVIAAPATTNELESLAADEHGL